MKGTRTDRDLRFQRSMRIALVLVVCWMATGVVLAQDETGPGVSIPDSLVGPDGYNLFGGDNEGYDEMKRCLAHESSVPGQALHVSGSTAGLVLGPIKVQKPSGGEEVEVASKPPGDYLDAVGRAPVPADASTLRELLTALVPQGPGFIVILVPDDFGPAANGFQLDSEVFALGEGAGSDLVGLKTAGKFSHGALVLHHLNALIKAMGKFDVDISQAQQGTFVWTSVEGNHGGIVVQGVPLGDGSKGITSEQIALGIRTAIIDPLQPPIGGATILGYVVNMSWVLLPCATVEAFAANISAFKTFEQYIDALAESNAGTTPETLTRLLTWVSTADPLFELIDDGSDVIKRSLGTKRLAFVAASGNFLLGYQMLPAAWRDVVGVGAYVDDLPPPAFSNAAEVVAPGAWFKLARMSFDSQTGASGGTTGEISYAGTSFGAPFVSLFTALDMANASRCTDAFDTGNAPGLASEPPANAWLADAQVLCPY